jgi:hypothetical protein
MKKSKASAKEPTAKKRTLKKRTRFARRVIHMKKVDLNPKYGLQYTKCRAAMQQAVSDMHLARPAVLLCRKASEHIVQLVAEEMAILLHYSKKRTATDDTLKLAIRNVSASLGVLGVDLTSVPDFTYEPATFDFIPQKGLTTAAKLQDEHRRHAEA